MPEQFSGGKIVFSTNSAGSTRHQYRKKVNMKFYLVPYTKITSKWIINVNGFSVELNIKPQTLKCLEDNIGENLCDFGVGKSS